jgi:tetratricopeptide (TPR) repeat protein
MTLSLSRLLLAATLLAATAPIMAAGGEDKLPALERALDLARAQHPGESVMLVPALTELARAYRGAGHNDRAKPLYEQAIHLDEVAGSNLARLGVNLVDLALVYRAQDRLHEAQLANERALPLLERALEPDDPEIARCLTNLAVLYWRQGEISEARRLQERALSIVERTLGPSHKRMATLRQNLALMASPPAASFARALVVVPPSTDAAASDVSDPERDHLEQGKDDAATAPGGSSTGPARRPLSSGLADGRSRQAATPQRLAKSSAQAGQFAVLVSSMRDLADVPEEWHLLQQHYPALAGLELWPPAPEVTESKIVYRLVAGSFAAAAEAEAVCNELRWQDQHCRVVPTPEDGEDRGSGTRSAEQLARGDFAIQIALVRDPAEVLQEWRRLERRHPSLTKLKPLPPRPVGVASKGTFYGVVGGSFATRAEAQATCERLREEGGDCLMIAP